MRILISSLVLDLSGTPTYTLTLYNELVRRGHDVTVYSPGGGFLFKQMNAVTTLSGVIPPDVIIAQMNVCAKEMREVFPNVPMMFSAHGVTPETEKPPSADVQWYTAINEDVVDNLVAHGANLNKINIVRDFVNTDRYRPIQLPNDEIKRVLFISNFKKWKTYAIICKACQKLGIELKAVGSPYGRSRKVEEDINQADLVIGVGRSLLEGMACGRPVISFNQRRGDGYLTPDVYMESRTRNFAQHKCRYAFNVDGLMDEIKKYNPADGIVNRQLVMMHHNHVRGVDRILGIIDGSSPLYPRHTVKTLDYIEARYNLDFDERMPIEIPNVGRDDLARLFAELDFQVGVEIGVEQGEYGEMLCQANPQAKIYGVDPWMAYAGYREHDPDSQNQNRHDEFYKRTKTRLAPYDYKVIRKFSLDAVHDFDDESLDWVYIDGNHELPFVINDIFEWSKKVRKGGIVAGHDYVRPQRPSTQKHVVYAVTAYTKAYSIRSWFLFGRKAKVPGEVRDNERSWVWVK